MLLCYLGVTHWERRCIFDFFNFILFIMRDVHRAQRAQRALHITCMCFGAYGMCGGGMCFAWLKQACTLPPWFSSES